MTIYEALAAHLELTAETAAYPPEYKLTYPVAGLVGESGEIVDKVKKILRRGVFKREDMTPEDILGLQLELGDVCWYAARCIFDTGMDPKVHGSFMTQADMHNDMFGVLFQAYRISNTANDAAEAVMVCFDNDIRGANSSVFYASMKVLRLVGGMAEILGTDLQTILDMNRQKLLDRRARNVIIGEGDSR